ncbi:MAG: hypothetical protein JXA15_05270 [Spirochaetales bacterium]|nr:hypothetical protein [Spirochaetales bacterium]
MKRRVPVVFLALSFLVFALSVGTGVYRVLLARHDAEAAARSAFDALRREATAMIRVAADAAGPEWNQAFSARWEASPALLAFILRDASGIIQAVPASSPFIARGGVEAWPAEAGFAAPKGSTLKLGAVIGGDPSTPISVQALYSTLPVCSVWKAVRDTLLVIAVWLAGSSLILAATRSGSREEGAGAIPPFVPPEAEAAPGPTDDADAGLREPFPWELPPHEGAASMDAVPAELPPLPTGAWDEVLAAELPGTAPGFEGEEPESDTAFDPAMPELPRELDELPEVDAPSGLAAGSGHRSRRYGDGGRPAGLYSPLSGLGWESYLPDRLDAELRRAAGFEQDLCLILLSNSHAPAASRAYGIIAKSFVEFFTFRDLSFEFGVSGMSAVLPNVDVEHGLRMGEEFLRKVGNRLAEQAEGKAAAGLAVGISARAGRLVEASRVLDEARAALERAQRDGSDSRVVAFKPDPDRYRNFVAGAC